MWVIIPLLAIVVGGVAALITRDWRRSVLVGAVGGVVGALFMMLLIYTGMWSG
ncbi:MAG TPA: hypothetical protein VFZ66_13840 [Herpetosiphonaceae bacterium]